VYIAPFTAMTIAEHFRDEGRDTIVILDDLTTHAKYYREIALLGGKFPGRESYPGDIFYTHSRLLERAGNFEIIPKKGGGLIEVSITALPVAETLMGDFTGYVQTNLASITDGHLFFDSELFLKGVRPAINIFLSVTRVGRQTQGPLLRSVGFEIMTLLKKHSEFQKYLRFGAEVTETVRTTIENGDKIYSFFNQTGYTIYPSNLSAVMIAMIIAGKWDGKDAEAMITKLEKDPKITKLVGECKTLTELVDKLK
jgi:F-type H+-transporting ATPase subunit alpha